VIAMTRPSRLGLWLAGRMPALALAAGVLLVLSLLLPGAPGISGAFSDLLQVLALAAFLASAGYYAALAVGRLGRLLLWRVRRRLVITFLLIGVPPVVLMGVLGVIAGFGILAEAMARIVTAQIDLALVQTQGAAAALVEELQGRPGAGGLARLEPWLEDKARTLQAALPGARLALWCCEPGEGRAQRRGADLVVEAPGSPHLGGRDPAPPGGSLPHWLAARRRWSGLVYAPGAAAPADAAGAPTGEGARGGALYLRSMARGVAAGRPFDLLLDVPLEGPLLGRLREATGLEIEPFQAGAGFDRGERPAALAAAEREPEDAGGARTSAAGAAAAATRVPYVVLLAATHWGSGRSEQHAALIYQWSWSEAMRQVLGLTAAGTVWKLLMVTVAGVFLLIEMVAFAAAALLTRSVTATVHELSVATERVRRGDFSYRARARSRDQLGDLAEAFNDMSASIESLLEQRLKHERLEREIEIAAEVQERLFPRRPPRREGWEIAGECRAARGVAGDYYDFLELGAGRVGLALGDVAGKGISASLLMSNLQATLRALAGQLLAAGADGDAEGRLAEVMGALNRQMCRSTAINRYATLFLGVCDERGRQLRYVNGGHGPGLLVRRDGRVKRLDTGGTVVGAFERSVYREGKAALEPGSVLALYSDGLSEAADAEGNEFGDERLERCVVGNRERPVAVLARAVYEAVEAWTGGGERTDDQTLVVLKVL
jgi:sigma-B regulation protein RsbU (phosphoserine phosphatase)